MGEHVAWSQTGGGGHLLPNGLLPNAGPLIESLDSERWLKAEERTAELIACIQPNQPSEERRNAVADYVQRLIMKCFPCQVFTFGSVPLKTYLPDGDIDLTAFSNNPNLKDSWATEVRDMLDSEEKNENAEFHVKEVQYIQAEVKIIKCLVENIVVDISFNQLGGLCTLCFLEEVDNLINQNHLFKRSIILIKAWCYYESRILGAHHGLISTYALETLVLYIFHVFNNSFAGPLEVLYRFLEFFSNFDWENFCVSLWGPVPISSLPDVTAEPPRKDSGELLLNKVFLDACSSVYAVLPGGQDNQGQAFLSKHFNVIDPLRVSNNLGRSVSKGNFFRIRSAFAFGAKRLARLLDCPKENLVAEVNQFFTNTWDRHGSGNRPDAPATDLKLSTPDNQLATDSQTSISSGTKSNESLSRERGQINLKSNHLFKDIQRTPFARTQSSPELTDTYKDVSSQGRLNRPHESGKNAASPDTGSNKNYRNRRKNVETEPPNHAGRISGSGPLSGHQAPPRQSLDASVDSNIYQCDSGLLSTSEEMHQEEQDLVNMMASSVLNGFNGQVHMPMNLQPGHLPFPVSPSFLASMGYSQRIPLIDHGFPGMQFPHGLVSPQLTHYFSGIGLPSNSDDSIDRGNENISSVEMNSADTEHDSWLEPDVSSGGGFEPDPSENNLRLSSTGLNYIPPPRRVGGTGGLVRSQLKSNKEKRLPSRDGRLDHSEHQEIRGNDDYSDERTTSSRFTSVAHSNSQRSQTSSENSWDERSTVPKSTKEKRGKKVVPVDLSSGYAKGKAMCDDTDHDWVPPPNMGSGPRPVAPMPGYDAAQTSGSDPVLPVAPMILHPNSRQRTMDSSGASLTFYPTGPPVPFLTMLPFYNVPSETAPSGASTSHFGAEENVDHTDIGLNFRSEGPTNSDILNSDFASHWQNLQFGRFCQSPRQHGPTAYPSPMMVPPIYLQGRVPWDGPGRPTSNVNLITQLMSYGPRLVPVAPLQQSVSSRPPNAYQRYGDDVPRYRSGTGTYLPNPKVSPRDRHSTGLRRGNFNYDRGENHVDKEGTWNINSKPRGSGRNLNRNQTDKSSTRSNRFVATEPRAADRSTFSTYQTQNGPLGPTTGQSGPSNVVYGVYPLQGSSPGEVSSNGSTVPSLVMVYPYDHNAGFGSATEPHEFGSVGFDGVNEQFQLTEGSRGRGTLEEYRLYGASLHRSSPDQPSSPHHQR